jgi:Transposase DDE domain
VAETLQPREPRASTTDAQARVMKMADGGFRPAYHVQFATDTKSTAIAGVSVDNIGSDEGKMAPMNDLLAGHHGRRPSQQRVDGGFVKFEDIEVLAKNGVETFAPVPKPRNASQDRYAPQPDDSPVVAAWRQRMGGDEAKAIYKQRAASAACANAQARNRGLTRFLVGGMEKVKTTALWYALAHNMACSGRLIPTSVIRHCVT